MRKYGLDLPRVSDLLAQLCLDELRERRLCYEHQGRLRITLRIATHMIVLVVVPVEMEDGTIAAKPISFRDATRAEERHYWRRHG